MNYGYDRHLIARGIDRVRRHSIEEIANDVAVPPSYLRSLVIERDDDFGDGLIEVIAGSMGVSVERIIRTGR